MAYHHACYEKSVGKAAKRAVAKHESSCQLCGKVINVGDFFTWTRRTSSGAAVGVKADGFPSAEELAEVIGDSYPQKATGTDMGVSLLNVEALATALVPHLRGTLGISEEETLALVARATEASHKAIAEAVVNIPKPLLVEVKVGNAPHKDMGVQHRQFPDLLKACMAAKATGSFGIWLAGPSGSGKTTAAFKAAEALGLARYYTGAVGDQYGLIGYKDANGNYVRTAFRDAYENGGLFLWDEVDASDPSALLAFNAALCNGHAAFPDGVVARHPDFVPIAAANTFGHGGTHEYVGRMKLDMAFLKRFAFITWEYDWEMVKATCGNAAWCTRVKELSEKVRKAGIRVLVTPREVYIGEALMASGLDQDMVEAMTIRSGMTQEQWYKVSYQT